MSFLFQIMLLLITVLFMAPDSAAAVPIEQSLLPRVKVGSQPVDLSPDELTWLNQRSRIRLGIWSQVQPPYRVEAGPDQFEGLTADYLFLLQQSLPLTFVIQSYPDRASALQALIKGEIDLLPASRDVLQRHSELIGSTAWVSDHAVFIKSSKNEANVNLKGTKLLYIGDEGTEKILHEAFPQVTLVLFNDYDRALAEIVNQKNTLMWSNDVTVRDIIRRDYKDKIVSQSSELYNDQSLVFLSSPSMSYLIDVINKAHKEIDPVILRRIAEGWKVDGPANIESITLSTEQREWVKQHPSISVLVNNEHEPMTFLDEQGRQTGFIFSLLQQIGQRTGLTFNWVSSERVQDSRDYLRVKPDSLIALIDSSADQDPNVIYSRPYLVTGWVLVTRKNSPEINSIADMSGKTVAVYPGSYYLPELKKKYPKVKFVEESFSLDLVFSLWMHQLDGAILPQTATEFFLKSYLADRFKIATVLPLPPLKMSMATTVVNKVLISIINDSLMSISPQALDTQLSGWQLRFTLERLNIWGRYQNIIIISVAAGVIFGLMLVFFFWRNKLLKNNLLVQQALQRRLQAAKTRVDKISESKSTFLSQMSHEIRTPMNALIGLLELESKGHSSPEQRKNNIKVAYESARSLLMLLGDILDLAKIESGKFEVRSNPLSLKDTLNSIGTLFNFNAEEKGISLTTSVEVIDDVILFDPIMLKQIISNLVSNAIKFTDEGEVEVVIYQAAKHASEQGEYVLEVCDSGVGMTPEQQKAVFEPYVQLENNSVSEKGTGLGLSICRNLADLLGGKLDVESAPGEGSTFIFRFSAPIWQKEISPDSELPSSVSISPLKILVVDDHPANRSLLQQQLEYAGHNSVAAENGEQAQRIWLEATPPFDAVITDCNMPLMSGFELVRQLRLHEKASGVNPQPMFGLTAMAEESVIEQAKQAGMTDCLFKPVELSYLLDCLAKYTHGKIMATDINKQLLLTLEQLSQSQPETFRQFAEVLSIQNQLDRARLCTELEQLDYVGIASTAHSLSGGAHIVHAETLAEVSKKLEIAAKAHQRHQVEQLVKDCVEQIDRLHIELLRIIDSRPD